MAITKLETIYVIEMINVKNEEVVTLSSAYKSLDDAFDFVDTCKRMDEDNGVSERFSYRVRTFSLFR